MNKKLLAVAGIAAATALILSGCSSADSGGGDSTASPATGEPIIVAGLSGLTFFPEAPQAVQAVFDDYNEAGGFNGQPIEYTVYDDKTDPAASATAAKDALDSGAVALVGSSSLLDCAVNHTTWEDNNIVSLQGTGVDSFCFGTPNIAPANTGPYFDMAATLWDGSENLGYENICALLVTDDEVGKANYYDIIANWEEATGNTISYVDDTLVRGQASYAANISNLKSEECDAIVANEVGVADAAIIAEASNQGLSLPFLVLTSAYSDEFAASVNYAGPISLPAEFAPFTDPEDTTTTEWRAVMEDHGVPATSFAQGGFLAAQYFITILETIEGDVTRDSFTEAARGMTEPYSGVGSGMTGTPWIFGEGESHQPNAAAWPMIIEPNTQTWVSVGPWLTGDEIGFKPFEVPAG
jgi:branched-chain amino acid transport system substrate-binding protein